MTKDFEEIDETILDKIGKSTASLSNEEIERITRYVLRTNGKELGHRDLVNIAGFRATTLDLRDGLPNFADLKWEEGLKTNPVGGEERNYSIRGIQHDNYPELDRTLRSNELRENGNGVYEGMRRTLSGTKIPVTTENIVSMEEDGIFWSRELYSIEDDLVDEILSGKPREEINQEYRLEEKLPYLPDEFSPDVLDWIAAAYLRWMPKDQRPDQYNISQKIEELEYENPDAQEVDEEEWEEIRDADTEKVPEYMKP